MPTQRGGECTCCLRGRDARIARAAQCLRSHPTLAFGGLPRGRVLQAVNQLSLPRCSYERAGARWGCLKLIKAPQSWRRERNCYAALLQGWVWWRARPLCVLLACGAHQKTSEQLWCFIIHPVLRRFSGADLWVGWLGLWVSRGRARGGALVAAPALCRPQTG